MAEALDLEAIRARVATVPGGPWEVEPLSEPDAEWKIGKRRLEVCFWVRTSRLPAGGMAVALVDCGSDAEFIAHAPADIRVLIEEVARLRAALRVYADHSRWDDISGLLFCESDDGSPSHGWDVAEAALKGAQGG